MMMLIAFYGDIAWGAGFSGGVFYRSVRSFSSRLHFHLFSSFKHHDRQFTGNSVTTLDIKLQIES